MGHQVVKKATTSPIVDLGYYGLPYTNPSNNVYSMTMSLCEEDNYFTEVGSTTARYSLYYGLYRLSRPGIPGMPPIYFEFNYAQGMTWVGNPDMNIFYGSTQTNAFCSSTYRIQTTPYVYVINSMFDASMSSVFGLSPAMDYVVTENNSTISSFWGDNAISVGFGEYSAGINCANNVLTFYADNSGSTCASSNWVGLNLVGQCTLNVAGQYDSMKPFIGSSSFLAGNTFTVHVQAHFIGGESIDQCQTITLVNPPSGTTINTICSLIRGNIDNYSSSAINYQIDIYQ